MESMDKLAMGTERYIKPQMEIIEMENNTIVTSDCLYVPGEILCGIECPFDGFNPCDSGSYDASGESITFC